MSDYHLPKELIVEISKRLPVKSLLRFRCVSKSWCSLITTPNFINAHTNQNSTSNNTYILFRNYSETLKKELYTLHSDKPTFDLHIQLEFPFKSFSPYFRIVGSCNGLICLADTLYTHKNDIILWNPSIRKFLNLPLPSIRYETNYVFMSVLGFGFDPRNNDYKVVRIASDGRKNVRLGVEIYELSKGSWRVIDNVVVPPYELHHCWLQANLNGNVHWLAVNPSGVGGFQSLIVGFNMSDEVFREIMLPPGLADVLLLKLSIAVCENSLALCHYYPSAQDRGCNIWVRKEEEGVAASWCKFLTIDLEQGVGLTLSFRKNGFVLFTTQKGELVSYDPGKRQVNHLGIFCGSSRIKFYTGTFYLDTYMESLVFLDRENEVSGYEPA